MGQINFKSLIRFWQANRTTILIVGAALLLTIFLLVVRAGAPFASFEAESANLSGNTIIKTDSNASDSKYVEFVAGSVAWRPAGSVLVQSGDNLANLVSSNPANTTFAIEGGKYSGSLPLKAGNKYIGNPSNRPEFIGGGINGAPFINANVHDVTVENIVAHHYGRHNDKQRGAMVGTAGGNNWTFRNVEFSHSINGIVDFGRNWLMENSKLHHGGRFWGTGGQDATVRRTEMYEIATGSDGIPVPSDGNRGSKFALTDGWTLEDVYVHDVDGNCIWFDIGNTNVRLIRPHVERCVETGIFLEVSIGPFYIEDPVIGLTGLEGSRQGDSTSTSWPTPAGILISLTPNVTINNPTVTGGRNGITAIQWAHPQVTNPGSAINERNMKGQLGLQNIIVNGGKISGVQYYDAGMAGGYQTGTLPPKNIHWNNVDFDTDAKFRSSLHIN